VYVIQGDNRVIVDGSAVSACCTQDTLPVVFGHEKPQHITTIFTYYWTVTGPLELP
jgi:hypothetical protein